MLQGCASCERGQAAGAREHANSSPTPLKPCQSRFGILPMAAPGVSQPSSASKTQASRMPKFMLTAPLVIDPGYWPSIG